MDVSILYVIAFLIAVLIGEIAFLAWMMNYDLSPFAGFGKPILQNVGSWTWEHTKSLAVWLAQAARRGYMWTKPRLSRLAGLVRTTLQKTASWTWKQIRRFAIWLDQSAKRGYAWTKPRFNRRNAKNFGTVAGLVGIVLLAYAFVRGAIYFFQYATNKTALWGQSIGSTIPLTVFYIILPLLGYLFLAWTNKRTKRSTTPSGSSKDDEKKPIPKWALWQREVWKKENEYVILLFFIVLHIGIWLRWPEWFEMNMLHNWRYWGLIACTFFTSLMMATGKKPLHHTLGTPATIVMLILVVSLLFGDNIKQYTDTASRPLGAASLGSAGGVNGLNTHVEQAVYDFFYANLPSDEAFKMTRFAARESSFRQFEPDGTPLKGREKDGTVHPEVVGVLQINKTAWAPELAQLGLNPDHLEDNLKMALWIHKNRGDQYWDTKEVVTSELEEAKKQRIKLVAPAGEMSESFDVSWRYCDFDGEPAGDIFVYDDRGNEYKQGHGDKVPPTPTNSWRYKSQSNEDVEFYVACVKK